MTERLKNEHKDRSTRHQFITRIPSSSVLSASIGKGFDFSAFLTQGKIGKGVNKNEFLQELTSLSAEQKHSRIILKEDATDSYVIVEVKAPEDSDDDSTPATTTDEDDHVEQQTNHRHLKGLVSSQTQTSFHDSVKKFLTAPYDVSRLQPISENFLQCNGRFMLMINSRVKFGKAAEFLDILSDNFADNSNVQGASRPSAAERHGLGGQIGLNAFTMTSDPHIFNLLISFSSEALIQDLKENVFWASWKRNTKNLLDGPEKVTRLRVVFNSKFDHSITEIEEREKVFSPVVVPELTDSDQLEILNLIPELTEHSEYLKNRHSQYKELRNLLCEFHKTSKNLDHFVSSYQHFGLQKKSNGGFFCREWIPGARQVYVMGEFNEWARDTHALKQEEKDEFGADIWYLDIKEAIPHQSKYRLHIEDQEGNWIDRVSPYARYVVPTEMNVYDGVAWFPNQEDVYKFEHTFVKTPQTSRRIYEAHVGISSGEEKVCTYNDFRKFVLPRIEKLGFNVLLLIGIIEHDNYSLFGWHSTNYFAPSSRFGTPEEFKQLVDEAHRMKISVCLSISHSHASPSDLNGLANFNGTSDCFFAFLQKSWDARVFKYDDPCVLRFLLSNLSFYMREFKIDGFRFDGVTSMIYKHQGVGTHVDGAGKNYHDYFNYELNETGVLYLMLANDLLSYQLGDQKLSIADERTGFPTLCHSVHSGGVGFDFRMNTHSSDMVLRTILEKDPLNWDLSGLVSTLAERRTNEKVIGFTENYDNSLLARRPLKVALFSWESLYTHAVGGVAPHVTELAAGLARLGHEIHVFTRSTTAEYRCQTHHGVIYHECSFNLDRDFVTETQNMSYSFVSALQNNEGYSKRRFDIVHAHDWLAEKAIALLKYQGYRTVYTMHSTEFGRCGNNQYGGQSKRISEVEREACAVADRVICVSGVLADEVKWLYGIDDAKLKVVYNGIKADHYDGEINIGDVKAGVGISVMDPMFLCVGRMVEQKGVDLLIEAVPHVLKFRGDAKFVIVGDGHMLNSLKQRSDRLGVGHAVRFVGKKGGGELVSLFRACDAVIVPSRNEPFGIVVLEGWSASKPVIATTSGGPRDFVSPGVDGVLVQPEPGSISWGCCEILKNFEHARWMGSRGRVKAAFSFSWDTIARQTRDIYYEQLNRHDTTYCQSEFGASSMAFRLMGGSMFDSMGVFDQSPDIEHGSGLWRLLTCLTSVLASDAFLNFSGNEFGHPEYVDMPRPGNGFSMHFARRQWHLAEDPGLKYKHMQYFVSCLVKWELELQWTTAGDPNVILVSSDDRIVVIERGDFLFLFNFHPAQSYSDYNVGTTGKDLTLFLNSDEACHGGRDSWTYFRPVVLSPTGAQLHGQTHSVRIPHVPPRTVLGFAPREKVVLMSYPFAAGNSSVDDFVNYMGKVGEN
eukprot:GHVP01048996.1.p1 GENE.GHVP01048996.1~~GHVP01048996.1.p1  ORF type:complete len:1408 (+),score=232.72 GHVP01048996.1:40-4263(+)